VSDLINVLIVVTAVVYLFIGGLVLFMAMLFMMVYWTPGPVASPLLKTILVLWIADIIAMAFVFAELSTPAAATQIILWVYGVLAIMWSIRLLWKYLHRDIWAKSMEEFISLLTTYGIKGVVVNPWEKQPRKFFLQDDKFGEYKLYGFYYANTGKRRRRIVFEESTGSYLGTKYGLEYRNQQQLASLKSLLIIENHLAELRERVPGLETYNTNLHHEEDRERLMADAVKYGLLPAG
jgi:hypothetical protein